ncbi:MAG: peptidoglycan DD-metalloendopeptidase family protein [Ilumatobacteraceae bacterium]
MLTGLVTVALASASCPVSPQTLTVPVRGTVIERFLAPACERCAGRRGIVVRVARPSPVLATATGEVTFAGQVGGALWVVQQVAPGVRVTYGRLSAIAERIETGVQVPAGGALGEAQERVYLGVRVGNVPRNPLGCWARRVRLAAANVGRRAAPR